MKRYFSKIIFIVILLSVVASPLHTAYAIGSTPERGIISRYFSLLGRTLETAGAGTPLAPVGSAIGWASGAGDNSFSAILMGGGGIPSIYSGIAGAVLELTTLLFNKAVYLGVYKLPEILKSEGVENAWKICRDLANLFFIFIILYIAIKTIFGETNSQKLITQVIIAALFVNFSAVLPRVVIDVSNVVAVNFYENLGPPTNQGSPERDITNSFIDATSKSYKPQSTIWALIEFAGNSLNPAHNFNPLSYLPGTLMFVLAYILLAGSILFVLRIVILILLVAFSPLAVIGWIVPTTATYSKDWLSKLINEALFAPVFMILIYLSILILGGEGSNLSNLAGTGGGGMGEVVSELITFIVTCSLLLLTLYISKKFSSTSASYALGWTKSAKNWFMGAAGGAAGAYTLGKVARKIGDSEKITNFAAKRPFIGGLVKGGLEGVADYKFAGGTSYKDRIDKAASRIEGFKTSDLRAKYLSNLSEVDRKAAYKKLSDREKAELHEHVGDIVTSASGPGQRLTTEQEKIIGTINGGLIPGQKGLAPPPGSEGYEKIEAERKKVRDNNEIKKALKILDTQQPPPVGTTRNSTTIQSSLKNLKGKNINKLDPGILTSPDIAPYLSISHLSALKEHPNLSDNDKEKIKEKILEAAGTPGVNALPEQTRAANWLMGPGGQDF